MLMFIQYCFFFGIWHALIITSSNMLHRLLKISLFFCFTSLNHTLLSFLGPLSHNRCHHKAQSQMYQYPNVFVK